MEDVTFQQKFIDFANVLKAFIGCSYISMPFAFHQSGVVMGIILLILIGGLNDYCCVQIVKCKGIIVQKLLDQFEALHRSGYLPHPEVELMKSGKLKTKLEDRITLGHIAKYAFGKKGQWVVTVCVFISQFGFCTSYFVFVGNTLLELVKFINGGNNTDANNPTSLSPQPTTDEMLIYMLLVPLPLFLLFSLLRQIRHMGWISFFANVAICLGYFIIFGLLINDFTLSSTFQWFNFKSAAVTFGMLTSTFEGIGTVIPIETSMVGNRHNFPPYLHGTILLIICMLGSNGMMGYLRYGDKTQQMILHNLPHNVLFAVVDSILVISAICTYPLQIFPIVEIVEFLFFRKRSSQFLKDRQKLMSKHDSDDDGSDFEGFDDELLEALNGNDSDDENVCINNRVAHNYGSTHSSFSQSLNSSEVYGNPESRSAVDSIYSKKLYRVIRTVYNTGITASTWKRNLIRVTLVLLQLGLAIIMRNNFGYLGAFIGAIGCSFLCFILPAATHFKLTKLTSKWYWRCKDVLIVLFGICGSIASLIVTIYDIINKSS